MFSFSQFPTIITQRLILRQLHDDDKDSVFAIRSDYEVTKYNTGVAYTTLSQAERLLASITNDYNAKAAIRWGITIKPDDGVVGMVGYNYWNRIDNRGSIGFDLARSYWRQGIMREAVLAILNYGFLVLDLHRIEADASIYNLASIGLLESVGFVREGIQRDQYYEEGTYHDLVMMSILAHEWAVIN